MSLNVIQFQTKTKALPGTVEAYWFENERMGLKRKQFHRIQIPLKPFDSGLGYEKQPVETQIEFDWYELKLSDPSALNSLNLSHENYADAEASVYVGNAHNWCNVEELIFSKINQALFSVQGRVFIEFESEGVGKNEEFEFTTQVSFIEA